MTIKLEIENMKAEQAAMRTDINWIKKEQCEQSVKLDRISIHLSDFIESADSKYASKDKVAELDKQVQKNNATIAKYTAIIGFVITVITIAVNILL